jgi:hypothetical protein
MTKVRDIFPLGKAYGSAFCNREAETLELVGNLQNGKHSFLAAPRRYGKSSLCEKAMHKSGLPFVTVDLHTAMTEKGVERCIMKGVLALIGQAVGQVDKSLQLIKQTFRSLKPKLSYQAGDFHLEIDIEAKASVAETIREMLLLLDELLTHKKKEAVLLIDEFQRVIEIAPDSGIEGGIRSAAQETKKLALIFSGSNRHLIESIFQDSGRPLYKLCKKIKLQRISREHYRKHLNKAAKILWHEELPEKVFAEIMRLTEQHPYYVNYLCDYLWSDPDKLPTVKKINQLWYRIIEEERSDLLREFFSLSENQKRLLKYIALNPEASIYSAEASAAMSVATTSASYALNVLLQKDMLEHLDNKFYRVINPTFKTLLQD